MTQTEMPGPLPEVPCCMGPEHDGGCLCGLTERVLRAGVALTAEQREWCLQEIGKVEGYKADDYRNLPDVELGGVVLSAWTDYCRDKGMM